MVIKNVIVLAMAAASFSAFGRPQPAGGFNRLQNRGGGHTFMENRGFNRQRQQKAVTRNENRREELQVRQMRIGDMRRVRIGQRQNMIQMRREHFRQYFQVRQRRIEIRRREWRERHVFRYPWALRTEIYNFPYWAQYPRYQGWLLGTWVRPVPPVYLVEETPYYVQPGEWSYLDVQRVSIKMDKLAEKIYEDLNSNQATEEAAENLVNYAEHYADQVSKTTDFNDTTLDLFAFDKAADELQTLLDSPANQALMTEQLKKDMGTLHYYLNELLWTYRQQHYQE